MFLKAIRKNIICCLVWRAYCLLPHSDVCQRKATVYYNLGFIFVALSSIIHDKTAFTKVITEILEGSKNTPV